VVALDSPGQGRTRVLDPEFGYEADAIARSIAGFLDVVGLERTAIVGHSWAADSAADPGPRRARGSPDVKDVDTPHAPEVLPPPRAHPETLISDVVHEMRSGSDRAARWTDLLRVERSVSWADTERDLHLVHASALLLWGKDRYLPSRLIDRFATRPSTVEHHVLPDCGHSLRDDCPEQIYVLLSPFLQGSG
jgi:pimeloyl-ACP methyl ester carboxylesterase